MELKEKPLCWAIAIVVAGATLVACSSGSGGGLSGKSASQVLALTTAAAKAKGSVHLSADESFAGQKETSEYDISGAEGKQTIAGAEGSSLTLVVGNVAYLQGDVTFLQSSMGFPASAASTLAGRWISFTPSDQGYQDITAGDTLGSALTEATPAGVLTLAKAPNVDGQAVLAISGGLAPTEASGGTTGSQVLYVAETAPHLPVEAVLHETQSGKSGTATISFSKWGEPVAVTAPSGAVPISSLTSGG